jgi:hypothetical protein
LKTSIERELDGRALGACHVVLAVGKLTEHPPGEHLLEPAVEEPAREARIEIPPERTGRLPLLDDPLHDRERLAHLVDAIAELVAARDLANHDGDERRVVAPRPKKDLRDALELLVRRLVGELDSTEARDELTPVLAEDRLENVVLRREVVVEEAVRHAGVLGDVPHAGAVVAAIGEHTDRGVEDELPLLPVCD